MLSMLKIINKYSYLTAAAITVTIAMLPLPVYYQDEEMKKASLYVQKQMSDSPPCCSSQHRPRDGAPGGSGT